MGLKAKLRSDVVRKILFERNQPLKWLTMKLGTSSGYMSQMMNGSRFPSPQMRQKLMDVLKVSQFNELFRIKK
jgi:transcriptional regulator with XRE-family HTH domain